MSVIVPCRNEEQFIGPCLDSILHGSYPQNRIEVLVVDGKSVDNTRAIVETYEGQFPQVRLYDNPEKSIPSAMNVGIRHAGGDIILKMDAHASYPEHYVSTCVKHLVQYEADNVGGVLNTIPSGQTIVARAIALALSHPFGAGNAQFRTGSKTVAWVDTVFGGCYKKEVFAKIGMYNENLARSSDMDLNVRLRRSGGRILLVPEIMANYYPTATLATFCRRNFIDGLWAIYPLKFGSRIFSWRHLISLAFVSSIIGTAVLSLLSSLFIWMLSAILGLYFVASGVSSLRITIRERDPRLLVLMPLAFSVRHVAYGLGSLFGVVKLLGPKGLGKARSALVSSSQEDTK